MNQPNVDDMMSRKHGRGKGPPGKRMQEEKRGTGFPTGRNQQMAGKTAQEQHTAFLAHLIPVL